MNRPGILTIFTVLLALPALAMRKSTNKITFTNRTTTPPSADGILNDPCREDAYLIRELTQFETDYVTPASQKTHVLIVYDDEAIYVGALLYDTICIIV